MAACPTGYTAILGVEQQVFGEITETGTAQATGIISTAKAIKSLADLTWINCRFVGVPMTDLVLTNQTFLYSGSTTLNSPTPYLNFSLAGITTIINISGLCFTSSLVPEISTLPPEYPVSPPISLVTIATDYLSMIGLPNPPSCFTSNDTISFAAGTTTSTKQPASGAKSITSTTLSAMKSDAPLAEVSADSTSNSARVAIGVGVGIGGVLVLAALIFFIWRRRLDVQQRGEKGVGLGNYDTNTEPGVFVEYEDVGVADADFRRLSGIRLSSIRH